MFYMTTSQAMTRVSLPLTKGQLAALRAKSKETGASVSELIRRAITAQYTPKVKP